MWTDSASIVIVLLAVVPAILYWINIWLYRPPPSSKAETSAVSVLVPARNEEHVIAATVESALASRGIDLEVIVLNDHSDDRTSAIVQEIAARDGRMRLIESEPLPKGWCGKQFACHQLARQARHDLLLFVDADVRLALDTASRLCGFLQQSGADLVSGVPRQETVTLLEKLLIPLIHFLLLGYLPLAAMRWFRSPAFGAGCGQIFLARRSAYEKARGHAAVKSSRHDGVTLPRAFRRAGFGTDLCDVTDLATCRMYRSARELWLGLAKNAGEGLGSLWGIVPWTVILLGGQVAPFALLLVDPMAGMAAIAAGYSMRLHAAARFQQSRLSVVVHPLGIIVLLTIQWWALACRWIGRPIPWKNRTSVSLATDEGGVSQPDHADAPGVGVSDSPT
jgi:hypothetical protein